MMSTVKLWRAQVGKAEGVDVSRKSAGSLGLPFAPSWQLVQASKQDKISWAEYRSFYQGQLLLVPDLCLAALHAEGMQRGGELCLLCYCSDDTPHCHTLLLIEWLTTRYPTYFEVKL